MLLAITSLLLALLLTGYAAACNAKMDTVKDHWKISIYAADSIKYDEQWFNPAISWANKNNWIQLVQLASHYLPDWAYVYLTDIKKEPWSPLSDFWHWEKAKMICSLVGAASLTLIGGFSLGQDPIAVLAAATVMFYVGGGIVWNETFNYYYDRKLIIAPFKKKWLWLK